MSEMDAIPDLMSWGIKFLRYSSQSHLIEAEIIITNKLLSKTQELSEKLGLEYCRGKEGTYFSRARRFSGQEQSLRFTQTVWYEMPSYWADKLYHWFQRLRADENLQGIHFFNDDLALRIFLYRN